MVVPARMFAQTGISHLTLKRTSAMVDSVMTTATVGLVLVNITLAATIPLYHLHPLSHITDPLPFSGFGSPWASSVLDLSFGVSMC